MALQRTFNHQARRHAPQHHRPDQCPFEAAGLRIVAQKRKQLSEAEAQAFYAVHKERLFYNDLVAFMTSGPVALQVLKARMPSPEPRSHGRHEPGRCR